VLKLLFEKYRAILSVYDHGQIILGSDGSVSGNKPYNASKTRKTIGFIDEDLRNTYRDTAPIAFMKCRAANIRNAEWRGAGLIPAGEEDRLRNYVAEAHKFGKKVSYGLARKPCV